MLFLNKLPGELRPNESSLIHHPRKLPSLTNALVNRISQIVNTEGQTQPKLVKVNQAKSGKNPRPEAWIPPKWGGDSLSPQHSPSRAPRPQRKLPPSIRHLSFVIHEPSVARHAPPKIFLESNNPSGVKMLLATGMQLMQFIQLRNL